MEEGEERRRGRRGGGGDAARRHPARAALSTQPVLGDRGPWAGPGDAGAGAQSIVLCSPAVLETPLTCAGGCGGPGRRHCPRDAAAPCRARSSRPARAASPAEPVPPAPRSAAPRTTTPTMPRAPVGGEGAAGRGGAGPPARAPAARVPGWGGGLHAPPAPSLPPPRPAAARQVRASGSGSSCFHRPGSSWVLPPASPPRGPPSSISSPRRPSPCPSCL